MADQAIVEMVAVRLYNVFWQARENKTLEGKPPLAWSDPRLPEPVRSGWRQVANHVILKSDFQCSLTYEQKKRE